MRARMLVAGGLLAGSLVLTACKTTESPPTAERPQQRGPRMRDRGPALGAYDESFRREAGLGSQDIFAALELPTPNDRRLASGAPGPGYWQQRCDYKIDAELDAETQRLEVTERVTYHNNSPNDLDYIWMQMEQNLFRPDSLGTLSRTPGGVMKQDEENFVGGFDVHALTSGGSDLTYHVYDTMARVELPRALESGQEFTFEVSYAFDMPPHLRRMGADDVEDGVIFEYAQWFPAVCKYDDVYGWNTLPYLGTGEFYADYGDYEVNITVPSTHLVGASGELINPHDVLTPEQYDRMQQASGSDEPVVIRSVDEITDPDTRPQGEDTLTWRFRVHDARTFAWASSPAFAWDACKADVTALDGSHKTVLCQSLYPREATAWAPDHEAGGSSLVVKHSIEFYSKLLYPYAYPSMTNVNGAEGGMEYPGIVFCGSRTNADGLFGVTDHEVGHSWFPMMVNSDERRHVWMDEGFNSFINMYSRADWKSADIDTERARDQTLRMSKETHRQAMDTPPDQMWGRWLGFLGYRKPAYSLYLLREVILGPERFDTAFREYVHNWAFKSPQPSDFFRTMENASGMDLAWFWRGWVLGSGQLDQSVDEVVTASDTLAYATFTSRGDVVMPVLYRVTYDDGTSEDRRAPVEAFYSSNRWRAWWNPGGRQVTRVEIDPDGLMPDVDRENNAR
ncbi:MAG: M1 family metallopeptidase [Phycisphaerales bacterium]